MNLSEPFIRRPVATTLLTIGIVLAGAIAFFQLPVAATPRIDFPVIAVMATLPGGSPEVVSSSVATPLERHLGAIAFVNEMTSSSSVNQAQVVLQFDLSRNIDGASRDVMAAINASRADLPTSLRTNPSYRKFNPADMPIAILALASDTMTPGQIYDAAATIFEQRLSQVRGVGQVTLRGSSLPAVRVEINPHALFKYGIGLEDVRAGLTNANAHAPKGAIEDGDRHYQIYVNDQARLAAQYRDLIIGYRNNAPVRLSDVAQVIDSVENIRNAAMTDGRPAIQVMVQRQPDANIIDTVDRIKALIPELQAALPGNIEVSLVSDRSSSIRTSLFEIERTLVISVLLVTFIVFVFLRDIRSALIPTIAVPVSLIGTFGVMYLFNFSLDNFSLMALTVATGFVVDDAIVVLENVTRHLEAGKPRLQAALIGAREVGFTVISISLSLVAVFLPMILMGGIVGRLFSEFAVTLAAAVLVSMVVSLTTTPMMCAFILPRHKIVEHGAQGSFTTRLFDIVMEKYGAGLDWSLRHKRIVVLSLFATIGLNFYLFYEIPKGFFPQQDNGRLRAFVRADQNISFQAMKKRFEQFNDILRADPAVQAVTGSTGGGSLNTAEMYIQLKPMKERNISADMVIQRIRRESMKVPGAQMFLQSAQEMGGGGGRQGNAQYQYTLQSDNLNDLNVWVPKLVDALQTEEALTDVNSDQQQRGLETFIVMDRDSASKLGVSASQIDNTLYDAFGQRQVSTIYNPLNQYHVVMELSPEHWQSPEILKEIYVSTSGGTISGAQSTNVIAGGASSSKTATSTATTSGADAVRAQRTNAIAATGRAGVSTASAVSTRVETMIPLSTVTKTETRTTALSISHQGLFVATTITFNLKPGKSLSDAVAAINRQMAAIGVPVGVHGEFSGSAKQFQEQNSNNGLVILAAIIAVYIVLGVLYESYIHPVTILSTLPSAGVGAVMALRLCNVELNIIAIIGVILLIGIVKKNAIMMIDFALEVQRRLNLTAEQAIREACLKRFRPILMTTLAAMLGALPLAVGLGDGFELRQPLGISIVGGLALSQILTLFTTPVVYVYLDRFSTKRRPAWLNRAISSTSYAT
jgi:multidrug efflux pump